MPVSKTHLRKPTSSPRCTVTHSPHFHSFLKNSTWGKGQRKAPGARVLQPAAFWTHARLCLCKFLLFPSATFSANCSGSSGDQSTSLFPSLCLPWPEDRRQRPLAWEGEPGGRSGHTVLNDSNTPLVCQGTGWTAGSGRLPGGGRRARGPEAGGNGEAEGEKAHCAGPRSTSPQSETGTGRVQMD